MRGHRRMPTSVARSGLVYAPRLHAFRIERHGPSRARQSASHPTLQAQRWKFGRATTRASPHSTRSFLAPLLPPRSRLPSRSLSLLPSSLCVPALSPLSPFSLPLLHLAGLPLRLVLRPRPRRRRPPPSSSSSSSDRFSLTTPTLAAVASFSSPLHRHRFAHPSSHRLSTSPPHPRHPVFSALAPLRSFFALRLARVNHPVQTARTDVLSGGGGGGIGRFSAPKSVVAGFSRDLNATSPAASRFAVSFPETTHPDQR